MTSLPMSAAMFWAVLPTSAAVFSAVFWSYCTVTALPSLLTLHAPRTSKAGTAIRMRMGVLLFVGGSTPFRLFRSRVNSARQNGQHRRPGGDVLPQLSRVDLVERVVGRVMVV